VSGTKFKFETQTGREKFVNPGVDERIILKCVLKLVDGLKFIQLSYIKVQ
jgi:hypothetical protein